MNGKTVVPLVELNQEEFPPDADAKLDAKLDAKVASFASPPNNVDQQKQSKKKRYFQQDVIDLLELRVVLMPLHNNVGQTICPVTMCDTLKLIDHNFVEVT